MMSIGRRWFEGVVPLADRGAAHRVEEEGAIRNSPCHWPINGVQAEEGAGVYSTGGIASAEWR
jgi:hypothetical protein